MPLRETTFIARNVEAWRRLELELTRADPDPDVLRDLYAAVSDDLSYARTHYPNRSVRSYLNHRAAELSLSLYRNRRDGTGVVRFFTQVVPAEIYRQRGALLLAVAIFLVAFAIGWGSAVVDPEFASQILSENYVDKTEANIAAGDPMAVYKDGSMLGGALGIAGNNLFVSMLCFVGGILGGVGTLFVLLQNGVMVGTFQQFFFARGVGWESVLGIWTHGTIEITCIVVAAGAGLVLARGILQPGTLSRSRAFQLTALSGLRIMAGIAPLIVLAAIIEGFLTRMTDVPTPLRVMFLLLNVAFCVYYFIIRPTQVGRGSPRDVADYGALPPDRPLDWREHQERTPAESFFDTARYFGGQGLWVLGICVAVGVVVSALYVALHEAGPLLAEYYDRNDFGASIGGLLEGFTPWSALAVAPLIIVGLPYLTYRMHASLPGGALADTNREGAGIVVGLAVPWLILAATAWLHAMVAAASLPLLALWMRGISYHRGNVALGLTEALRACVRQLGPVLLLWTMLLVSWLIIGLCSELLWGRYGLPFVYFNVPIGWSDVVDVYTALSVATDVTLMCAITMLWIQAFGLLYHSLRERHSAEGLRLRLDEVLPA